MVQRGTSATTGFQFQERGSPGGAQDSSPRDFHRPCRGGKTWVGAGFRWFRSAPPPRRRRGLAAAWRAGEQANFHDASGVKSAEHALARVMNFETGGSGRPRLAAVKGQDWWRRRAEIGCVEWEISGGGGPKTRQQASPGQRPGEMAAIRISPNGAGPPDNRGHPFNGSPARAGCAREPPALTPASAPAPLPPPCRAPAPSYCTARSRPRPASQTTPRRS